MSMREIDTLRIGLITSLATNIGDDLIRRGIMSLLSEFFDGRRIEWIPVNKHKPLTVFPRMHPVHQLLALYRRTRVSAFLRLADLSTRIIPVSRFDRCDLIVQCGAPVIWDKCHLCEWNRPIYQQTVGRLHSRIPFINLAMGGCYPCEQRPNEVLFKEDQAFIRSICRYSCLSTARDALAHGLITGLGCRCSLVPCAAFLSGSTASKLDGDAPILINYMQRGGHYDWGQKINDVEWERTVGRLAEYLSREHSVRFVCHNQAELELARRTFPQHEAFLPASAEAYFDEISHAKLAINNRLHASVAMASVGIPSIAIGTDTRLDMVSELGLKTYYVKEATYDRLLEDVQGLLSNRHAESARLLDLKRATRQLYLSMIKEALGGML
jgi:hypothetical protein